MRAWLIDADEGVDNLRFAEVPDPEPGPGQVLLRVRFAALNPADAFLAEARQRAGVGVRATRLRQTTSSRAFSNVSPPAAQTSGST